MLSPVRRSRLPWLLAVLGLALAACGNDDRLSREQYVSRANALCRENDRRVAQVARDAVAQARARGRLREDAVRSEVLNRSLPSIRSLLERLRRLRPPEEDERRVDRFLDQIEEAARLLPEVDRATRRRDQARLSELATRLAEIAGPSRRFARDYGLRDCLPEAGRI